jgi:hypothetical protein
VRNYLNKNVFRNYREENGNYDGIMSLPMFIERVEGDRGGFSHENFFGWDGNGSIKVSKETLPTKERG